MAPSLLLPLALAAQLAVASGYVCGPGWAPHLRGRWTPRAAHPVRFLVHTPRHGVDARMCAAEDEAYYTVAEIRDKQVVANAERGGMVSIPPFFCPACTFYAVQLADL